MHRLSPCLTTVNTPLPIRLAVVDDSVFIRKALCRLFEDDERFEVVGAASCGEELLDHLESWNPTAITLDLSMPGMGGLATLGEVLRRRRIPVIILSAHTSEEAPLTIEALHRGAADFVDKEQYSLLDFHALRSVLTEKLLNIAGAAQPSAGSGPAPAPPPPSSPSPATGEYDLLLIGASTGGPPAIERILLDLGPVSVPIAIVQHMPAGFTAAFADRLNTHLPFEVREASHGVRLLPGLALVAPAGMHLRLKKDGDEVRAVLSRYPDSTAHCPSVDVLFESAEPFGRRSVAVLLTGMGEDGAGGLLKLSNAGAMTLTQDEATSIVYGMPRAAIALNAAREQLPLPRIGSRVAELLRKQS